MHPLAPAPSRHPKTLYESGHALRLRATKKVCRKADVRGCLELLLRIRPGMAVTMVRERAQISTPSPHRVVRQRRAAAGSSRRRAARPVRPPSSLVQAPPIVRPSGVSIAVSGVAEPQCEALLHRDRKRLQAGRQKVVEQLVAHIAARPAADQVGDDNAGVVRPGEGGAVSLRLRRSRRTIRQSVPRYGAARKEEEPAAVAA